MKSLRSEVDLQLQNSSSLESGVLSLQSDQEGSAALVTPEKGPDDGYSWRKYGQKNVKGNIFVRSYYRCTHPDCQVKEQVECSQDGVITDTVIFGNHDHQRTRLGLPVKVRLSVAAKEVRDIYSPVISKEKSLIPDHQKPKAADHVDSSRPFTIEASDLKANVVAQSTKTVDNVGKDVFPNSKRQKKESGCPEATTMNSLHVLQTVSDVDVVNDGYRWRKYGQKFVKGNRTPGTTTDVLPPVRMVSNSSSVNHNTNQLAPEYSHGTDSDSADKTYRHQMLKEQLNEQPRIEWEKYQKAK